LVQEWVDEGRIPGAVLTVWRRGEPLLEQAYGSAQTHSYGTGQYREGPSAPANIGIEPLPTAVPMAMETVFDLASLTKVMATTMAVAILVDRDRLELDAPVSRYLPDFVQDGREAITIEHLLTHRSGLPQWKPTYYHADDADEAYAYLRSVPLEWPVGEGRHYSDLGFMLLGRIIETVSGSTLDAFVRNEFYDPLGLTATGFGGAATASGPGTDERWYAATSHGNPFEHRMVHDTDFGYGIEGDPTSWNGWRRYTLVGEVNDGNAHHAYGGVAGHAGLFSTARELQVILRVLLDDGEVDGRRYLGREVVDRFLEPTGEGQALGWQVPEYGPAGAFSHTGFTGTYVLGDRESGVGLVLLTNRQNGGVDAATQYPDLAALQRGVALAITGGDRPDGG
jgi:CubicO group peptidase (beta-lactamase class C family)